MTIRTFLICTCLAAFAACTETPTVTAPTDAAPDGPDPRLAAFADDVQAAQAAYEMPAAWSDWMIQRKDRWADAYLVGVGGKTSWRLNVVYDREVAYAPAWTSEAEHMAALKKMMELQFPGWTFTFGLDLPDADRTVHLGETKISHADGTDVHLVWEGILAHEFGHTVGLRHHYSDTQADSDGVLQETPDTEPPGESDCIMSRDGVSWGQTEQFLLRLAPPGPDAPINAAITELNRRYPKGWPNV